MKALRVSGLLVLLFLTWSVAVYHRSVFPIPLVSPGETHSTLNTVKWIPKEELGIHQLILEGNPYEIGLRAGEKTREIIYRQEKELVSQLHSLFPNPLLRRLFELTLIRWFWGIQDYFEPWMIQEMYGVSQFTSEDFNYLGNPLTRQVSYHGLHEVGQMMVDQGSDSMGCTVVAFPLVQSSHPQFTHPQWVIGRNFDFEAGRVFDSEKIMKWVFPKGKYAYLSVIWAGMVGAVTGVNEHGVYISLNAAGSMDFRRFGTPSTLIVTKALQEAKTAREAVEIIRQAQMFITDIFVVSDQNTGDLFRVEKSPKATEVIQLTRPSAITNHLISSRWTDDSINKFRKFELTSYLRATRAEDLLGHMQNDQSVELSVLKILRDKGEAPGGHDTLELGNRRAIDSLIATHSVIYNEESGTLFVSQGPGVSGPYLGFNLALSFKNHRPVRVGSLPSDPLVTPLTFFEIRRSLKEVSVAQHLLQKGDCRSAGDILKQSGPVFSKLYSFYSALGDYFKCVGNLKDAKISWQKALRLSPAYPRQVRDLQERLK